MTFTDRRPLTRQRVADAALDLIDAHGLDALSMRKLGAELGVEAMSLYNHVENKADLLLAVADRLFGDVLAAYGEPAGDWKVHARALSHAYVDVAARHPAAVRLLIHSPERTDAAELFDRSIVDAARLMTDDDRIGAIAFATISNWVLGTIVQEHGLMGSQPDTAATDEPADPDDGVSEFQRAAQRLTADERFNEGLEIVLAGLDARFFGA